MHISKCNRNCNALAGLSHPPERMDGPLDSSQSMPSEHAWSRLGDRLKSIDHARKRAWRLLFGFCACAPRPQESGLPAHAEGNRNEFSSAESVRLPDFRRGNPRVSDLTEEFQLAIAVHAGKTMRDTKTGIEARLV